MTDTTFRTNPHTGLRYRVVPSHVPYVEDGCGACEDTGRVYNNADRTSGQWVPCTCPAGDDVAGEGC